METACQINTLHTFYSEISLQSDFIIWHRFQLILCIAMVCMPWQERGIQAQSIKKFLGDMRSIFLVFSALRSANLVQSSVSELNQPWNKSEAWVCQGDKNYLRALKSDNRIIRVNDFFSFFFCWDVRLAIYRHFNSSSYVFFAFHFQLDALFLRLKPWITNRLNSSIITSAIYAWYHQSQTSENFD